METPATLPKILERTCPHCDAKLDCDLPYCGVCGYGLPMLPRSAALIFTSTALYFVVGCPAGIAAIYCFTFCLIGIFSGIIPALILGSIYWACAKFMLSMNKGIRPETGSL